MRSLASFSSTEEGGVPKGRVFYARNEMRASSLESAGMALRENPRNPLRFRDTARTCCVIASGPSANQDDADLCRGWPTIAVNDSYLLAPWASALYACDTAWWSHHFSAVRRTFSGDCWTQEQRCAERYGLDRISGEDKEGLSREHGVVYFGNSSGYQAINMAFLWGARRLVLIGFDCGPIGGRAHWFGEHPKGVGSITNFRRMKANFDRLAADLKQEGVDVVNCSPVSTLRCWPQRRVSDVLCALAA